MEEVVNKLQAQGATLPVPTTTPEASSTTAAPSTKVEDDDVIRVGKVISNVRARELLKKKYKFFWEKKEFF